MTTADPAHQMALLALQRADLGLDRVAHRLRTLPALAARDAAEVSLAALRDRAVAAGAEVSDLERAVRKAEDDVEAVRQRATRDEELLISGTITSPKQLEELQHEVASLARRRGDLEDAELEVMERLESAVANRDELAAQREAAEAELADAVAAIAAAEAEAADERAGLEGERTAIAAGIPEDLLRLYEKIRADHGGIGAAPLHRGRCEGCQMQLPPSDIDRIRAAAADELLRCEECRRILVRTPESGL